MKTSFCTNAETDLRQACGGKKKELDIWAEMKNEDIVIGSSDWRYFDSSDMFSGIISDSHISEQDFYLLYL